MGPFELEQALAERIASGSLAPGVVLSDRALAKEHDVGKSAARQALGALSRRGMVVLRDGHEAVVSRPKVDHDLRSVAGFSEQMHAAGLEPATKLLSAGVIAAPPRVAAALEIDASARVAKIERIRYASKVALTVEEAWLPDALFPGLVELGLRDSLYALMTECYAHRPAHATERLEAVPARAQDAERLGIAEGAPLMLVERITYDEEGTPIEFGRDRHRGDRVRFVAESRSRLSQPGGRA